MSQEKDLEASKEGSLVHVSSDEACKPEYDIFNTWYGRIFAPLRKAEARLDRLLGVEAQGPARVLPSEREKPKYWAMASLWASGTMNLSCFATGLIGSELGLDLWRTIVILCFATLLGGMVTAWCATQGSKTGLRQVSISRYSIGWYPSKLIALLNVVEQLGWSSVSCITGGLALTAVSDGAVSLALGVAIVAIISGLLSFIGLRAVLRYEMYAWIPIFIIFAVMYGEVGSKADNSSPPAVSGVDLSGSALTWFSIVYGSTASWSSIASDYYVQYPVETPSWKVFVYTTLGLTVPTSFGMILGACIGSTILINPDWEAANEQGLGYLIQTVLYPYGWSKFVLVVLVLSGIGNGCIAIYSGALSIQQFARPLMVVPRTIWTLLVLAGVLLLGLVGRDHLLEILQNFLSLLGYWNTSFFVILFTEHYLFRKGDYARYDLDAWNTLRYMPIGFAGIFAFGMGVAGWILGMSETWYTGVIARLIGEGGDIGNELSFLFTIVSFAPARWLEYKIVGR
jgi:NCS1 nucleoside transporter family